MNGIKNIIFDFGGVILDLSVDHTLQEFSVLSGIEKEKVKQVFTSAPEFEQYEKGEMSDQEFRDFVRTAYGHEAKDAEIDRSWNAMLRAIPVKNLQMLTKLKEKYQLFLLSNTNGIHLNHVESVMLPAITGERSMDAYFHRTYYSHRMGKRKPNADIYEQVLDENGLHAEETLFLDDNTSNLAGARSVKIQTTHIVSPQHMLEYFHD